MDAYPKDGGEGLAFSCDDRDDLVARRRALQVRLRQRSRGETAPKGLNEEIIRFISAKKRSRTGCSSGD